MATRELALKLQRRLRLEQESEAAAAAAAAQGPQLNGFDGKGYGLLAEAVRVRDRSPGPPKFVLEAPDKELTANADSELKAQLSRRHSIHEGTEQPQLTKVFKPHNEFREFSRRQIRDMESLFRRFDSSKDGFIDLMELKMMMERLGAPQTHLDLKNMIREVDEDLDNKLSFREFLLIFRKAAAGELEEDSGLMYLAKLSEVDVAMEGVKGAKNFFEAKVHVLSVPSKFEAEVKAEQMARKQEEEDRRHRKALFRELQAAFSQ
ncbi:EF-hand domain-containing protein D1 [Antechinus flavipes]|uniref:EF-hand domain-containing protein D1 n=1 Tax=Antechinus flavipes TaxID=38775 RepID=UPI002235F137|nr:EF-hand domain-containing protein D1 [Antechinus flavipes]